jgi:type IV pilus assembly protein PilA
VTWGDVAGVSRLGRGTLPTVQVHWGNTRSIGVMKSAIPMNRSTAGFSLVELTIVVVILGVLATMAVPRYRVSVERAKSAEAFTYLAQVAGAQERYNARAGKYARNLKDLDIQLSSPTHFRVGQVTSHKWQTKWQLTLTRQGPSSGFGNYTVTWNQIGFSPRRSSVKNELVPVTKKR